jgi:hypothetical protein
MRSNLEHEDACTGVSEVQLLIISAGDLCRTVALCRCARTAVRHESDQIRAAERDALVSLSTSNACDASSIFVADRPSHSQVAGEVRELGVGCAGVVCEAVANAVDSLQSGLCQVELAHRRGSVRTALRIRTERRMRGGRAANSACAHRADRVPGIQLCAANL